MELAHVWQAWSIAGPWHLTPLSGGTNNLVWRAETADGENYVLRVFPDLTQLPRLPVERDRVRRLQSILASVLEEVPDLYACLPQQLLHLDYGPDNIFMQDQRVTAVFDFEFAGIDLKVMELCVALSWWPVNLMGTGKEWEMMDAFATAYMANFPLSEEELRAIPAVLRLRDAGSLVHRMGRYFAGRETDATMRQRVEHSLWREAWLVAQSETLLHHAMGWS